MSRRVAIAFVVAGVLVPVTTFHAQALVSNVILASITQAGVKGDLDALSPRISGDGNRVMFSTRSTTLDPRDTDTLSDVYVKDLTTGELFLVSTSDTGVKGNLDSVGGGLSADGTKAVFTSNANNLDPVDFGTAGDVYVKDLTTGDLVLASSSDTGTIGNWGSDGGYISGDGTIVAFESNATNFDPADPDTNRDLYVKDLVTGKVTLVSTNDAGVKIDGVLGLDGFSADGNVVLFNSSATNLDPLDTDNQSDVYTKSLGTGEVTLVSVDSDGLTKSNSGGIGTSISADGSVVSFDTGATNLDPFDTDAFTDVYVKDLRSGELVLASTGPSGKGNLGSALGSLSADGARISFHSGASNLIPRKHRDFTTHVYVKDLFSGEILLASTDDLGERADNNSNTPSLSDDGSRVAFISLASNLDPADSSAGQQDIYVKELTPPSVQADLSIINLDRRDPVRSGATITYTLTIANAGPLSATGVTVTDQLPASVTFVSASGTGATCGESTGVVTCTLSGSLAPGARPPTVRVTVVAQTPGTLLTTTSVTGNEPDLQTSNNSDTESTTVT